MTRHIVKSSEPQEPVTEWSLEISYGRVRLWACRDGNGVVSAEIMPNGTLRRVQHPPAASEIASRLGISLDASGRIAMED